MAAKKKKKKRTSDLPDPQEVLEGKATVTALELVRLIHKVNPTSAETDDQQASERYRLKSRLQSLLIRRFHHSLRVDLPGEDNPQVVGLRLRHFHEDACHAFIPELEDDARSWVQARIDEAATGDGEEQGSAWIQDKDEVAAQGKPLSENLSHKEGEEGLTAAEWMDRGKAALEEYDYETCEHSLIQALKVSGGDIGPALALLDVLVEQLGAYDQALKVATLFSAATNRDPRVKLLLGWATAHFGRAPEALSLVEGIEDPRVVDIRLLAAKHFIATRDAHRAAIVLQVLKAQAGSARGAEIQQLEQDLAALRAKDLEPLEKDMMEAFEEEQWDAALKLAEDLLSFLPQNSAARHVRKEYERRQRQMRIEQILLDADEARDRQAFGREADLLHQAMGLGANAPELTERLKQARAMAERQREDKETEECLRHWEDRQGREMLLRFAGLGPRQRQRIMEDTQDTRFRWMEKVLFSEKKMNPQKLVEAILALAECETAFQRGENLGQIIQDLTLHGMVLQGLPEARALLKQAESALHETDVQRNKALLSEASQLLKQENGNLERASQYLSQIQPGRLEQTDRETVETLKAKLQRLEAFERLLRQYASSASRKDHLACMVLARRLAEQDETARSAYWREKEQEQSAALKEAWQFFPCDLKGMPDCYGFSGLETSSMDNTAWLFPDHSHILVATTHSRWLLVRMFSLEEQRYSHGWMLKTPRELATPTGLLEGDTLWLAGGKGQALGVCLDPVSILAWYDFSAFVQQDDVVESCIIFPQKGMLWISKRNRHHGEETTSIIHLKQERVIRTIRDCTMTKVIPREEGFEISIPEKDDASLRILSEEGRVLGKLSLKAPGVVTEIETHPNGKDYVFLSHEDTDPFDPWLELEEAADDSVEPGLHLGMFRNGEQGPESVALSEANGEAVHSLMVSRKANMALVTYRIGWDKADHSYLAAFKVLPEGFESLYRFQLTGSLCLFSDPHSEHIAAMYLSRKGIRATILDERRPHIEVVKGLRQEDRPYLPVVEPFWFCDQQSEPFKSQMLAYRSLLKDQSDQGIQDMIEELMAKGDPKELSALLDALSLVGRIQAEKLRKWMEVRYPDHAKFLLEKGAQAFSEGNWDQVISLLQRSALSDLDGGKARHRCHLLGIALYLKGDIPNALVVWEEGMTFREGTCNLHPYMACARLSLMPGRGRKRGRLERHLENYYAVYEATDRFLEVKDWQGAVNAIESGRNLEGGDVQLLARLSFAYLHLDLPRGDIGMVCKVLALSNYRELMSLRDFRRWVLFPSYIEPWPKERLDQLDKEAALWLGAEVKRG